jgi:uncharacterized protein involved in exopolysaccharide biosynthesis
VSINIEARGEDEIDLPQLFAKLWQKRWWIIGSMVVFTTAFAIAAFTITPIYRAATVLVPASSERGSSGILVSALGQLGGLASLAGISVGSGDAEIEEALAVLRSRQFTERFIAENNLLPKLFAKKWDATSNKWKVAEADQPTLAKANEYFSKKIRTVIQEKKTGLVTLQIDWRDRNEAATWANELVQRLNSEMRARGIAQTDASLGYLEKELKSTAVIGTQEAINRLIEAQIKQRMLANVSQEYSFRVIDKALAPDGDDSVMPKKLYLLIAGPFVGLALGVILVLVVGGIRDVVTLKTTSNT